MKTQDPPSQSFLCKLCYKHWIENGLSYMIIMIMYVLHESLMQILFLYSS